jgi:hypothetical protein
MRETKSPVLSRTLRPVNWARRRLGKTPTRFDTPGLVNLSCSRSVSKALRKQHLKHVREVLLRHGARRNIAWMSYLSLKDVLGIPEICPVKHRRRT